jgi:hypothetical protein
MIGRDADNCFAGRDRFGRWKLPRHHSTQQSVAHCEWRSDRNYQRSCRILPGAKLMHSGKSSRRCCEIDDKPESNARLQVERCAEQLGPFAEDRLDARWLFAGLSRSRCGTMIVSSKPQCTRSMMLVAGKAW